MNVTDEMVQRFLCWRLPDTFAPDCYISFDREGLKKMGNGSHWPTGTNLLNDPEARAMLKHVLRDHAAAAAQPEPFTGFKDGNRGGLVVDRGALHASPGYKKQVGALKRLHEAKAAQPQNSDEAVAHFVEKTAEIISGAPFPSGRSLYKARQIADLALSLLATATQPQAMEPVGLLHCVGSDSRTGIGLSHGSMREWDKLLADRRVLNEGVPVYLGQPANPQETSSKLVEPVETPPWESSEVAKDATRYRFLRSARDFVVTTPRHTGNAIVWAEYALDKTIDDAMAREAD